jgi:xanthine dehydrogenase YagR molybdenum-binding subunit
MSTGIGNPHVRAEGALKVTGQAKYAADASPPDLAYGVFATSSIARGRTTRVDIAEAEKAPGVLKVLTFHNMPKLRKPVHPPAGQSLIPLQDDMLYYEGQPIALVAAESLEQAQQAARLVRAEYAPAAAEVDFREDLDNAVAVHNFAEPDTQVGNVEAALAQSSVRIERTYRTADRHHCTMEPSATVAEWNGTKLTIHDATQWVWGVRMVVAAVLGIQPEDIRVRFSFVGGGFGCKGYVWPHQILTAAAAREIGRPLKLVLTRAQTFTSHGYQAASEQIVTLGSAPDGRLTAIRHTSIAPTSLLDDYVEYAAIGTRSLYACPAIETKHRVVRVSRGTPTPMRAPHEGISSVGLECALDELAEELRMDPIELRLKNYAERDPTSNKPFSSKKLRDCYSIGAERFGWTDRDPRPGAMRKGGQLVGWGMATAIMTTFRFASTARVTLEKGGTVLIEAGTQEIGTGNMTILPQIAGDVLGIPMERIRLVLGDTTLPETAGTFGSSSTIGVGSAVLDAATKLKDHAANLAGGKFPSTIEEIDALLESSSGEVSTHGIWTPTLTEHRQGLISGIRALSAEGGWSPGPLASPLGEVSEWSMHTFGAVFVEVQVDEDLRIPRVTRCTGVYSAGRIINPKTARSQIIGGMVWGIGQALLERSALDSNLGRYVSKNLAGYLVPVNADVPELDMMFVDEVDPHASLLGGKGIGELGAVGVAPAILNAIWHATGIRVRSIPAAPEDLL